MKGRFWTKSFTIDERELQSNITNKLFEKRSNITNKVISLDHFIAWYSGKLRNNEIHKSETGVFVIHLSLFELLTIPILNSNLQLEEVNQSSELKIDHSRSEYNVTLCGFAPRALHMFESLRDGDIRQIDLERLEALNSALLNVSDISGSELLSDTYSGTPPARIYRSFVYPHPNRKPLIEPIANAASRVASQIAFSLRQVRADRANYLRNTDSIQSIRIADQQIKNITSSSKNLFDKVDNKIKCTDEMNFIKEVDENLETATKHQLVKHPIVLVLDNIRSAFNVGSIFRTAETAGVSEIIACGITAHPPHPKLQKTALSATETIPFRHFDDTCVAISLLKRDGYKIVVMETTSVSCIYTDIEYPKKIAVVLGNEITGVDPRVMECSDIIAEIPTYGVKNSLNVAAAIPIVLFEILRQWNKFQLK